MSQRLLTVLSIAVAFALLLLLGWRAFAPADPGAPPARPGADATSTANAALGIASPTATGEPVANAARSDATAPRTPQRLARIVDETRAPVANAEVAFDLSEDLRVTWQPFGFDVEERLAAAPRHRTASDGVVVLPTDAAVAFVIARAGERLGHGAIEFDSWLHAVPELIIAPDRTLRIAVVGPDGAPRPNVPVEVTFQTEEALAAEGTSERLLPRTDASGVTVFWHAQTLHFWSRAAAAVDLRAIVLGSRPPKVRVPLADPVPERIVLPCPDHGGIRVRAWSGRGVRSGAPLQPCVGEDGTDVLPQPALLMPGATPVESCVFPVALGKSWRVGIDARPPSAEMVVVGPVRHGDEVIAELPQDIAGLCTVLLLQPDGQPCALQRIEIDREHQPRWAETDAQGCLTVPVAGGEITFHSQKLHAQARVEVAAKAVPVDPAAPTDLGTVRLQAMSLLAAGHIVDATTRRPVQAYVRAEQIIEAEDHGTLARADAGTDGAFELWGEGIERFRLHAWRIGYTPAAIEMAAGARELVVVLQPSSLLRATVLVDPAIAIEDFSVRVFHGDDTTHWRHARIEGGRFHALFELPEGDDLVLGVTGRDELPPLRRVPAAQWTQSNGVFETTVDLRGELANVFVSVRQGDPKAETGGSLYVRPTGSSAPWANLDLAPRVVFAVPNGTTLDAIVRPLGGTCVRTTLRPGENTIEVPSPSVAQIEVTGLPPDVARTVIAVQVYWLVRREPLLDELVAAGAGVDPGEVRNWPRSAADLEQVADECLWEKLGEGPIRCELRRRGSYVAVPHVVVKERRVPLLDAAIPLEITTPGAVVEATIRLDPEKVRAALK